MSLSLLDALTAEDQKSDRTVIRPLSSWVDESLNQPLLFVKPEIMALGSSAAPALQLIEQALAGWNCVVDSLLLLGPGYLRENRLIEQHYGVINRYSERGVGSLTQPAIEEARRIAAERSIPLANIMGAHQFLRGNPEVSASQLLEWHENTTMLTKLSSGAYCSLVETNDQIYGVINGFHPAQLEHFYGSAAPILVATLQTETRWSELRGSMIGATNPSQARPGSLRNALLTQREALGIGEVSGMRNGVHLSAGPLEGAAEIIRYLSDHAPNSRGSVAINETNLGALLLAEIGTSASVRLLRNEWPGEVYSAVSPYDATEEVDTKEAIPILTGLGKTHDGLDRC